MLYSSMLPLRSTRGASATGPQREQIASNVQLEDRR